MKFVDWDLVSYRSLNDDDYEYDDDLFDGRNTKHNTKHNQHKEKEAKKSMDRNLPIHSRMTMNHEPGQIYPQKAGGSSNCHSDA